MKQAPSLPAAAGTLVTASEPGTTASRSEEATTLMEHLPQVHHDEFVTKAYLDMRLEAMEARISAKISQETVIVFALVAVVVSVSSVALFR